MKFKGGLHGIKARQELNAENDTFTVVSCHVYVGLTDEEELWLASWHNANGQFQHNMTHQDYVSGCHIEHSKAQSGYCCCIADTHQSE